MISEFDIQERTKLEYELIDVHNVLKQKDSK